MKLSFLLCLLVASPVFANSELPVEQQIQWYAVMLEGQKTGYMKVRRDVFPDRVEHVETSEMKISRMGEPITMFTRNASIETADGTPLGFSSTQEISGSKMIIEGTVANGKVTATSTTAGQSQTQTFDWPSGAVLYEGARLQAIEQGLAPGTSYVTRLFDPAGLQVLEASTDVGEATPIELFGIETQLIEVRQSLSTGGAQLDSTAYIDGDTYIPRKMNMSLLGLDFEMLACPEACATKESEPTEFFAEVVEVAPRALTRNDLDRQLSYVISATDPALRLYFPESSEQEVELLDADAQQFRVTVYPRSTRESPAEVEPIDRAATRWIQSEADEIRKLANEAAPADASSLQVMRALEAFVGRYVEQKNLSVGYASALEVAKERSGDCTEHAVLLAALGRARGIPTRIATGLAYVDAWLGQKAAFVPHAWTQAFVDGRWQSFDAALGGFDSGHIAFSYGNGDPWNFFEGINTLGNLELVSLE